MDLVFGKEWAMFFDAKGNSRDRDADTVDPLQACVLGPLSRPAADPAWLTGDVVALIRGIRSDAAFERLPILADALMEAGCEDPDILAHCQSGGPHVPGCWVVDFLLGTESPPNHRA
jgi:hypothetical protein